MLTLRLLLMLVALLVTTDDPGQPTGISVTASRNDDASECFAYVDFIAHGGTRIGKIVFSQVGGAIFEGGKHANLTSAPTAPGSFASITAVPEPSAGAMLVLAVSGLAVVISRRRRRK